MKCSFLVWQLFSKQASRDAEQRLPVVHQLSAAIPTLNTCQSSRTEWLNPSAGCQGSGSFFPNSQGCSNHHGTLGALSQPAPCPVLPVVTCGQVTYEGKKLLRRLLCFVQLKWGRCFSPVNRVIPGWHILLQRAFFPGFALEMWKSCMTQHSVVLHLNPFVGPVFISTYLAQGPNNKKKMAKYCLFM